jgi:hypothetical protein
MSWVEAAGESAEVAAGEGAEDDSDDAVKVLRGIGIYEESPKEKVTYKSAKRKEKKMGTCHELFSVLWRENGSSLSVASTHS